MITVMMISIRPHLSKRMQATRNIPLARINPRKGVSTKKRTIEAIQMRTFFMVWLD